MVRARAEQQPAATGTALIVMVGLGVAFLLFMAFWTREKREPGQKSNLFFAALIFYAGAGALYLASGLRARTRMYALPRSRPGSVSPPTPGRSPIAGTRLGIRRLPAFTKCFSALFGHLPCSRLSPRKNLA